MNFINERNKYTQEAQHSQQTSTRTAQNQDIETTCKMLQKYTEDSQKPETYIYKGKNWSTALELQLPLGFKPS